MAPYGLSLLLFAWVAGCGRGALGPAGGGDAAVDGDAASMDCGDGPCGGDPSGPICDDDGTCESAAGETPANCPNDCPADLCDDDGACETAAGETPANCPNDCPPTTAEDFTFLAWGDTKGGTSILSSLSNQAFQLADLPLFGIYTGDLVQSGFSTSPMDTWKNAVNGGSNNGMFDMTLPIRGNHDAADLPGWQDYFDLSAVAAAVGATNYVERSGYGDATYSFDVNNARFIAVDVPGATSSTTLDSAEIAWIDARLTDAEDLGTLDHAFLFWHGPIYPVGGHLDSGCSARVCDANPAVHDLLLMLNGHPIVSASFFGHEHSLDWTHLDETRFPEITHPFEEFVTGGGGAGLYDCLSYRVDECFIDTGFMTVKVSGRSFTVGIWRDGDATQATPAPSWSKTFTK